MGSLLELVWNFVRSMFKSRQNLVLENLALRQQLANLQRVSPKPRAQLSDRLFWVILSRVWSGWESALTLFQPRTIIGWQKNVFRLFWRWKSRRRGPGRPRIPQEHIRLIKQMWRENPTWGSPQIVAELAKLGIHHSDSTIRKYRPRNPRDSASQDWWTFIQNHVDGIAATDFFVVPTVSFRLLYVMVILRLDRRRIAHFNVTESPSSQWAAQQITEAFPFDSAPDYLIHDNDTIFRGRFRERADAMNISVRRTAYRSPWQNGHVERVIGTLRRSCLDHVIVFNERHLRNVLGEFVAYYHEHRPHQALGGDSPDGREVETPESGKIVSIPILGGLHHRYEREAA